MKKPNTVVLIHGLWMTPRCWDPFAQLRAASPVLSNPFNYRRTVMLTLDQFRYAFANTMSEAAARQAYDRDAIPGPGRPLFQAAFANFLPNAATKVDYRNGKRVPLLLIGGAQDHTVPASVCRSAFRKYRSARAVTEYKEFPDRCHLLITQDGWEEVADYAITWATTNFKHWSPQAVVAA